MSKILVTIQLAFRSLALHKLRSGLTILGIVFGVASVITMLAVGEGTSSAAQENIKQLGSNNIIIESVKKEDAEGNGRVITYGITYDDLTRILESMPHVTAYARQRINDGKVRYEGLGHESVVIACDASLFKVKNIPIKKGRRILDADIANRSNVCVITKSLATKLFPYQDPLSHKVSFDGAHYQVVGITGRSSSIDQSETPKIYIPFSTSVSNYGELTVKIKVGSRERELVHIHKLILQFSDAESVYSAHRRLRRIMSYGHKTEDYRIKVPIELIEQAKETQRIFSMLLGSIAGISLLVGGIGIMNIMLATVSERTKEIGLRRAIGAKKRDVVIQFMTESIVLSLVGGVVGVLLGVLLPFVITAATGIEAVVSPLSVIIAFLISGLTGVIFGSYPAIKSANLSPIEALKDM